MLNDEVNKLENEVVNDLLDISKSNKIKDFPKQDNICKSILLILLIFILFIFLMFGLFYFHFGPKSNTLLLANHSKLSP